MSLIIAIKDKEEKKIKVYAEGITLSNDEIIDNDAIKITYYDNIIPKQRFIIGITGYCHLSLYIRNNIKKYLSIDTLTDDIDSNRQIISHAIEKMINEYYNNNLSKYGASIQILLCIGEFIYITDYYEEEKHFATYCRINNNFEAIGYCERESRILLDANVDIQTIFDILSKRFAGKVNNHVECLEYSYA